MKHALLLLPLLFVAGCGSSWLPDDFEVPSGFETEQFVVRPIRASDAAMDFEAVMESVPIIHERLLDDKWPPESFALEENRSQLAVKERRFDQRERFTYTVLSPEEDRVLGCVYVNPGMRGPDAAVFMWVRRSAHEAGMDPLLEDAVRQWMDAEWPFGWVVYPGRGSAESSEGQPN